MNSQKYNDISELKITDEDDFKVEFNLCLPSDIRDDDLYKNELEDIESILSKRLEEIDDIDKQIDKYTNKADGLDYTVAVGSGILCATIDIFFVGDFSFSEGKAWSNEKANKIVHSIAKKTGYKGDRLEGAISHLENKYKIPSDNVWKGSNIKVSAKSHHLDDMAHHPTILGLICSILTQFTKTTYFSNREGVFNKISLDKESSELIGNDLPSKFFAGTINWLFHLISDMSGSNKTAGLGMGIPGPILSTLKEISMIPGINKTNLPEKLHKAFTDNRFDLRSEAAIAHQLGKQAIPVIINEALVRGFYLIRRLITGIKNEGIDNLNWRNILPFKNRTIIRMLTISTSTFTLIDLADASIRSAMKSGGNPALFISNLVLKVNFVGIGRCIIAVGADINMGMKRERLRDKKMKLMNEVLHLSNTKIFYRQAGMWVKAKEAYVAIDEATKTMEACIIHFDTLFQDNQKSLQHIGECIEDVKKNNTGLVEDLMEELKW